MGASTHQANRDELILHSSLTDPCLNTMTFLNDIASQYPEAISFAPGRPIEKDFKFGDISFYINT